MTTTQTPEMTSIVGTQDLNEAFARNVGIIGKQAAGLTHADSLLQPAVRGNCLNWVVGHIVATRGYIAGILGEEPVLMEAQAARYARGSAPIVADGDDVVPLPTLLEAFAQTQARIAAGLGRATPETLAREIPFGSGTAPVGQVLFTLYFHETYHTGQTEYLRQLAGTNDAVI